MDTSFAGQVYGSRARSRGFVNNYDPLDSKEKGPRVNWLTVAVFGGYFTTVFGLLGWGVVKLLE